MPFGVVKANNIAGFSGSQVEFTDDKANDYAKIIQEREPFIYLLLKNI